MNLAAVAVAAAEEEEVAEMARRGRHRHKAYNEIDSHCINDFVNKTYHSCSLCLEMATIEFCIWQVETVKIKFVLFKLENLG